LSGTSGCLGLACSGWATIRSLKERRIARRLPGGDCGENVATDCR
jgi:hypothetical protein